MIDIKIRRYKDHPHNYQGSVVPENGRWKLVLDEDGIPHLFLRVFLDEETKKTGWLSVDDLLPENEKTGEILLISDLMDGTVGEPLSPEEEKEAYEEYMARPHFCPGGD